MFSELASLCAVLRESARPEAPDAQRGFCQAVGQGLQILLDALDFDPATVDTLVARTGLTADVVASMLLILELEGRIEQHFEVWGKNSVQCDTITLEIIKSMLFAEDVLASPTYPFDSS